MARRSLRPHLNQIRSWVRQGRTDAWIAHQLEVTVQQIEAFKRENDLAPQDEGATYEEEVDLRAEDDARVAAELEAAAAAEPDEEDDEGEGEEGAAEEERPARRRSRRGRRGGRRRGQAPLELEGTFDHGEEGYGLWLDPAIQDDPVYAEHWAGHRPVTVAVEEEQIVIRRAGGPDEDDDDSGDDD
jgi:hypothetical protein